MTHVGLEVCLSPSTSVRRDTPNLTGIAQLSSTRQQLDITGKSPLFFRADGRLDNFRFRLTLVDMTWQEMRIWRRRSSWQHRVGVQRGPFILLSPCRGSLTFRFSRPTLLLQVLSAAFNHGINQGRLQMKVQPVGALASWQKCRFVPRILLLLLLLLQVLWTKLRDALPNLNWSFSFWEKGWSATLLLSLLLVLWALQSLRGIDGSTEMAGTSFSSWIFSFWTRMAFLSLLHQHILCRRAKMLFVKQAFVYCFFWLQNR